jgi:hypothetical protein
MVHEVSTDAPAVHVQLLASQLYEALRAELARTPRANAAKVGILAAAADQCRRSAKYPLASHLIVEEMRAVILALDESPVATVPERPRPGVPQLRVIRGGLA